MDFFSNQVISQIALGEFGIQLGLALIYAVIFNLAIQKTSRILGDRTQYTYIFPLLIPTMVLIITVIKSSLALSLGLVGALSIIRFRTPIKDPEELIYLFVAIAVGLGLGAGQWMVTSIAFFFMLSVLIFLGFWRRKSGLLKGVYIDIEGPLGSEVDLKAYKKYFQHRGIAFDLRHYQDHDKTFTSTYYIEPKSMLHLEELLQELKLIHKKAKITFLNQTSAI